MKEQHPIEEFPHKRRDFSTFLVHLTKDSVDSNGNPRTSAKEVLDRILAEQTLRAYNPYCLFNDKLKSESDSLQEKFKVVCFTGTPIHQIDLLLKNVYERHSTFKSYGLVFKKGYIKKCGGNPVFPIDGSLLSTMLQQLYDDAVKTGCSGKENKLLALVSKYDGTTDFHWEREWRIVGDLKFHLNDIYCGLCNEEDTGYFENKYAPVKFISPFWEIGNILDKLMNI